MARAGFQNDVLERRLPGPHTIGGAEQILVQMFHEPSLISRWRLSARLVRVVGLHYDECCS